MTDITETAVVIDAGVMEFNAEELTATGLLIPYGVEARSNLGRFTFAAGDIGLPEDLTGMGLNIEHRREDVVGAFTGIREQPEGLIATFKYRNTAEGRQAFEDGRSGKRKNLSAEVAKVRIQGGKALPGAVLFGAAQVETPAFAGATLLAAEDTTEPVGEMPAPRAETPLADAFDGFLDTLSDAARAALLERLQPAVEPDEDDPTIQRGEDSSDALTEPPAAPAEDTNTIEKELIMTASAVVAEPVVAGAQVPATLLASAPAVASAAAEPEVDLGSIFASIHAIKSGIGVEDATTLLAALTDIKWNASGGLTTAGSGILQPAWVGKLWQGKRYQRKYIDLATHLFGGITLGGRGGYTMTAGSELVAKWAGNKVELPSGGATTAKKGSTLQPYGWAADIAREWFDLEGGADLIESLLQLVMDSYARVTDQDALKAIFDAASKTSVALDKIVAPGTFPAQAGMGTYPVAMGQLIQGIDAIGDVDDEPAFAIVNPLAWTQLLYTPKDLVPEYVQFGVTAGSGEAQAGKVIVKKAPASFFTGLTAAKPQVIVGAKSAIEFRELGETPIQLDALDIAKGGVDKAVIGYLETFVVRPEALLLIGSVS